MAFPADQRLQLRDPRFGGPPCGVLFAEAEKILARHRIVKSYPALHT